MGHAGGVENRLEYRVTFSMDLFAGLHSHIVAVEIDSNSIVIRGPQSQAKSTKEFEQILQLSDASLRHERIDVRQIGQFIVRENLISFLMSR
jgi:hypothetical protein